MNFFTKLFTLPKISFGELKSSAKRHVSSNIFDYIGTAFLGLAIMFALSLPTLCASYLLLSGAFALAMATFSLQVFRNGSSDFNIVLSNYKNFGNAFITSISVYIRASLWSLLISIPFVLLNILISLIPTHSYDSYYGYTYHHGLAVFLSILSFILILAQFVITMVFVMRYSMTFYILSDNPNMAASKAVESSIKMMEGHQFEYFLLNLSFIGWYILCAITFGLVWIYVAPYVAITRAAYYDKLKSLEKAAPAAPVEPAAPAAN